MLAEQLGLNMDQMKKSVENLTYYLRESTIGSILLPRDRLKTPWPFIALYATEVFLFSLRFKCFPDTLDVSTAKNDLGASRESVKSTDLLKIRGT